jgi:KaiC/GvpD/RAD55 family RecA-like ATPase
VHYILHYGEVMETQLLKTLLSHDSYKSNKARLKRSLFSDDAADLYDILGLAHAKYEHDLTSEDLYSLWIADHPVATNTEKADFRDLIDDIEKSNAISSDVAQDVIKKLWQKEIGREITNLGINLSEGDHSAFNLLQSLIERIGENYMPDDFGPTTTKDLPALLKRASNGSRWQFNINSLSSAVYGIGPGEFMVLLARPETGKTAFLVSLMAGPGGFCDQGAKVIYLGNEEDTERTMLRAYQAAAGMDIHEVIADPKRAVKSFFCAKDNLEMKDVVDWDLDRIDGYCRKMKPDVLVIDQADKVGVSGHYNATHERFRELYRRLRELAKRHQCALIGISQASADAEGKTRVDFSMAEGSKTGKAAEADLIIGIGKHSGDNEDGAPDNTRFLTISKNKLSGYHGTIPVLIEPAVSRYSS